MGWFSNKPAVVPRRNISHLQHRGWRPTPKAKGWYGPFATPYGDWHGTIYDKGDILEPLIKDPPPELTHHPKWACFWKDSNNPGWFRIHLQTQPVNHDPSSVIFYVESLINEAFELYAPS